MALYAFCRLADDAVDLGTNPTQALHALQMRLDDICGGRSRAFDADRALADTVQRHKMPRALLDALLEGFCGTRQAATTTRLRNCKTTRPGWRLKQAGIDPADGSRSRSSTRPSPLSLALMARAALPSRPMGLTRLRAALPTLPTLQSVRFLVDAVPPQASAPCTLAERALWTIDLFERRASQQRAWR